MSLEASGSLGGALVFSKWKGRAYVRTLVKPQNPKSAGQTGVRSMFKFLTQDWANIDSTNQASWEDRADQKVVSPFNAFVGYNQFRWRDFLAPTQHDPEAIIDVPATVGVSTATPGVRSITVKVPITTAADGWGVMIFKSLETAFDTAFDNLVAVVKISATDDLYFVDSPLDPDIYYYNFREFTADGQLGDEEGEISGEVT